MKCKKNNLCGLRNGHYGQCKARQSRASSSNYGPDVFDIAAGVVIGEVIADAIDDTFDSSPSSDSSNDFSGGDFGGGGSDGDW